MTFEEAVERLAVDGGVSLLLTIPGVWEHVSESYNNEAIDLMNSANETEKEEEKEEEKLYRVHGYCDSENGDSFELGTLEIHAKDEATAENKAWEELWDSRLSGASCKFRAHIIELEQEEEEE